MTEFFCFNNVAENGVINIIDNVILKADNFPGADIDDPLMIILSLILLHMMIISYQLWLQLMLLFRNNIEIIISFFVSMHNHKLS